MKGRSVASRERSVPVALEHARRVRDRFVDLTHEIPENVPREVLALWNVADAALLKFIRELEALS